MRDEVWGEAESAEESAPLDDKGCATGLWDAGDLVSLLGAEEMGEGAE